MGEQTMKKYCPLCGEEMERDDVIDTPEEDDPQYVYYCVNPECEAFEG
jgi:hypothetical protein